MQYISPIFIYLDTAALSELIKVYASSTGGCGLIGCPQPANYQSGGGCGHAYNIGACDITHNT